MKALGIGTTFFILIICALALAPRVFAQSLINANDISFSTTPSTPGPNEEVSIMVSSYTVNLSRSTIKWKVDDVLKKSGIGETSLSVTTKGIGQTTNITIDIITVGGTVVTKEITLRPAEMDLLWEAVDSYTPPFYRGKSFLSSEGLVRVTAIPIIKNSEGKAYNDDDLVYIWRKDINNVPQASGYGKKAFTFKQSYFDHSNSVGVEVSSLDNGQGASKTISVAPQNPVILFYKDTPLEGVEYQKAISDVAIEGDNLSVVATPYFFSPKNVDSKDLGYKWTAGSDALNVANPKNKLTLTKGESKGGATVSLSIESISKLFQVAKGSFNVSF